MFIDKIHQDWTAKSDNSKDNLSNWKIKIMENTN